MMKESRVAVILAVLCIAAAAHAAVLPVTGIALDPPASGTVVDPADLASLTTSAGTVSTPAGPVSATNGSFGDYFYDEDGVADGTSSTGPGNYVGLDVTKGATNATSINVLFGTTLDNADSTVNDLFIIELGGNDNITVKPLDTNGDVIGDFSLSIASSDWGGSGVSVQLDGFAGGDTHELAGVAFEVSDFTGSGTLDGSQVAGLRTEGSVDATVIGYNAIPEPATLSLLALGAVALIRRRR